MDKYLHKLNPILHTLIGKEIKLEDRRHSFGDEDILKVFRIEEIDRFCILRSADGVQRKFTKVKLLQEYGKYDKAHNNGYGLKNFALNLLQQKRNIEIELETFIKSLKIYKSKKANIMKKIKQHKKQEKKKINN